MQLSPGSRIGILGGGQLGRMMAIAAAQMGFRTHIFCPDEDSPASHVSDTVTVASYDDYEALKHFATDVDVVTLEFENIPCDSLEYLEQFTVVRPSWQALHVAQNRLREKDFVQSCGIRTAPYKAIESKKDLEDAVAALRLPMIVKTQEFGYDGKGQWLLRTKEDVAHCEEALFTKNAKGPWIAEGFIPFEKEVSVIAARNVQGEVVTYPVVENIHRSGILHKTLVPASIPDALANEARNIATTIITELDVTGLLAVEMFVTPSHEVLVNEMAPRPHNSGHWSLDACVTSQFEQSIRVAAGLPMGDTAILCPAEMLNLIGDDVGMWAEMVKTPNAKLHLYGKEEVRAGRKMGHVNFLFPEGKQSICNQSLTDKVSKNEETT